MREREAGGERGGGGGGILNRAPARREGGGGEGGGGVCGRPVSPEGVFLRGGVFAVGVLSPEGGECLQGGAFYANHIGTRPANTSRLT
jgi:hypothetical protein